MQKLTREIALSIANEWINSWNSHDLSRVLSHYTEDFEMQSPFIPLLYPENSSGTLKGKDLVGAYWKRSMQKYPDLRFELIEVFFSVNMIAIEYFSVLKDVKVIEWLTLDDIQDDGRVFIVSKAAGIYQDFSPPNKETA
jgi:nuclear transport factor 2 (NTF2) superfamily protein